MIVSFEIANMEQGSNPYFPQGQEYTLYDLMCVYEFLKQRRIMTASDLDSDHGDALTSSVPSTELVAQGQTQSDDTELSTSSALGDNIMDVDMETEDLPCSCSAAKSVEHSEQGTAGLTRTASASHTTGNLKEDA